jgi:hypothetical protein
MSEFPVNPSSSIYQTLNADKTGDQSQMGDNSLETTLRNAVVGDVEASMAQMDWQNNYLTNNSSIDSILPQLDIAAQDMAQVGNDISQLVGSEQQLTNLAKVNDLKSTESRAEAAEYTINQRMWNDVTLEQQRK